MDLIQNEPFTWVYQRRLAIGALSGIRAAIQDGANAVLSLVHPGADVRLPPDVDHLVVPLEDSARNSRADVRLAVEYARDLLMDEDNRLLVHCHAGRSRSVVIASMALARHLGCDHRRVVMDMSRVRNIGLTPGIGALFGYLD